MSSEFQGRLALVTGASRGIGRAIALELGRSGAQVIALARTVGGLEELDDAIRAAGGLAATLVPLDMRDGDGLDRLGASILERWGKLDILVANAGILGPISPLGHIEPKIFADVLAVNVTANWRLIRAVDPLLRASDAGRVIVMSSGAARSCKAYWGPYSISKSAVEALSRTYAEETAKTTVCVTVLNPGPLRTKMRASAMPGEDPLTLKTAEDFAPHALRFLSRDWTQSGRLFDFPTQEVQSF